MSRGHGQLMQVTLQILIGLADKGLDDRITYQLLALDVFGAAQPTTSQRSSLDRATRRLAEQGLVRITTDELDVRRRLVRADPLLLIAARMEAAGINQAGVDGTMHEINALLHELWDAGLIEEGGRFPGVPPEIRDLVVSAKGGPAPVAEISPAARKLLTLVTMMMEFEEVLTRAGMTLPQHIAEAHQAFLRRNKRI